MSDPISAAIGGVAGIGSALIGARASKKAASKAAEAGDAATQAQLEMYYQTREDQAPWRTAGTEAVNALLGKVTAGPGEYEKSPYYDFLMGEGTKALERGAASRGNMLSGAQSKALVGYGQNLASTDYDKWLARWYQSLTPYQSLAGLGQTSAMSTGQLGVQAAGQTVQPTLFSGAARASGVLGQANTYQNLIPWGANMLTGLLGNSGGASNVMSTWGTPLPYNYYGNMNPYTNPNFQVNYQNL